jgi:hypothetical protein
MVHLTLTSSIDVGVGALPKGMAPMDPFHFRMHQFYFGAHASPKDSTVPARGVSTGVFGKGRWRPSIYFTDFFIYF